MLSPYLVLAVEEKPETNPLCWTEAECKRVINKGEGDRFQPENFLKGGADGKCGAQLGNCVPAGQTQAQITIGEKRTFRDLGEYIPTVYTYLVGIAGLLAALLIIKGGFEYITSAGDASRVTAAKETITNSIIGLVLVLGSYVVLNTINPELVNLKLPGVYMVRPIYTLTWCHEIIDDPKIIGTAEEPKVAKVVNTPPNINASGARCGQNFFHGAFPGGLCRGRKCVEAGKACVTDINQQKEECQPASLAGRIKGVVETPIDNDMEIWVIIEERGIVFFTLLIRETEAIDIGEKEQTYAFGPVNEEVTVKEAVKRYYGTGATLPEFKTIGAYLDIEVNEPNAKDDWYSVGTDGQRLLPDDFKEHCGGARLKDCPKDYLKNNLSKIQSKLWSIEQLKNSFPLDLKIDQAHGFIPL